MKKKLSKAGNGGPTPSAAGPYKSGLKTDQSKAVRKITTTAQPKPKDGSQFLPKGVPAGHKKNVPASKTKPRTVNTYPGSAEEAFDTVKKGYHTLGSDINEGVNAAGKWIRKDLGLQKKGGSVKSKKKK
jgi:hypothetical protein